MKYTEDYLNFILEQFSTIGEIMHRKMFGGVGFYKEGKMFALLSKTGTIYLKVDDSNREDFIEKGMESFNPKKKGKGMPYYEIPVDVLEDKKEIKKWAMKSWKVAMSK